MKKVFIINSIVVCIICMMFLGGCSSLYTEAPSDNETTVAKSTEPSITATTTQSTVYSTTKTTTQSTVRSTTKTTKQLPIQTTSQYTVLPTIPKTTTQTLTPVTAHTFGEAHPYIITYLKKDAYDPDEIVSFYMIDPTNTGFAFGTDFELWEADGDAWVKKSRFPSVEVTRILKMSPIPGKTSLKTSYLMNLAHYQNMQYGKKYKITVEADGYILSEEFTTISQ